MHYNVRYSSQYNAIIVFSVLKVFNNIGHWFSFRNWLKKVAIIYRECETYGLPIAAAVAQLAKTFNSVMGNWNYFEPI